MNKFIFSSALVCLLFLITGTYMFPDSMVMWFAGTSLDYTIARIVLALALVVVLATAPPRRMYMRLLMGALALGLVVTGSILALSDMVQVMDVLIFMIVGIAFGIEALEFNEDELIENAAKLHADRIAHMRTLSAQLIPTFLLFGESRSNPSLQ